MSGSVRRRPRAHTLGVAAVGCLVAALAGCSDPPQGTTADTGIEDTTGTSGFVHDELSMPAEPTLDPARFTSADACAACHPTHHEQWAASMHAYAVEDPVFRALVEVRQRDLGGEEDQFCMQCHTAIGTRGGEVVPGFRWEDLSPIVHEGITCESCHRVTAIARPYNSGHVLDPFAPMQGGLADPVATPAHASVDDGILADPAFCGGCHDVEETSGLPLERPYAEWLESPAGREGRGCISCHMARWDGPAAVDGPLRQRLHDHRFIGVDLPLTDASRTDEGLLEAMREDARALLGSAAELRMAAPDSVAQGSRLDVVVRVINRIDGHALPTGSTFLRQLWLELVVTDGAGERVYATGDLDDNGDLRNHWSSLDPYGDADLVTFGSGFVDAMGTPELFPWRASEHKSNAIPPLHERTLTYFVPLGDSPGPWQVQARLRFRTHPPFLLRALGLDALVERVETYDLAEARADVAASQ